MLLVVDDSPYNLFVMEELLKSFKKNLHIATALNGKEAIKVLTSKDHLKVSPRPYTQEIVPRSTFDLVFLDLHMPVLDGFQVTDFFI